MELKLNMMEAEVVIDVLKRTTKSGDIGAAEAGIIDGVRMKLIKMVNEVEKREYTPIPVIR